jgi:hypothetical protein
MRVLTQPAMRRSAGMTNGLGKNAVQYIFVISYCCRKEKKVEAARVRIQKQLISNLMHKNEEIRGKRLGWL